MLSVQSLQRWIASFVVGGGILVSRHAVWAQSRIVPDDSLGGERSQVIPNAPGLPFGVTGERIRGGAVRGQNLFHSFQDFNISPRRAAYFDNTAGATNIISRVTGSNLSDIQGILGVLGRGNLFLINPNGIIFGPGASLDVSGSFLATTADGLVFPNGFVFNARNPQAPPLLNVNVPIGLQHGSNPGAIAVNGSLLVVNVGQRLELSGGNVSINDVPYLGTLDFSGDSRGAAGELAINADSLTINRSVLSTTTFGQRDADNIAIRANSVSIDHASQLSTATSGQGNSGSIAIQANNFIGIGTEASPILLPSALITSSEPEAGGNAGNISIVTNRFQIANAAVLDTSANTGNAGNISITANRFEVNSGGQLLTDATGSGNAGRILINAADHIVITGQDSLNQARRAAYPDSDFPGFLRNVGRESALFASAIIGKGNGGNITLNTNRLEISNQAAVTTSADLGGSGNLSITAPGSVVIRNGFLTGAISNRNATGNTGTWNIQTGQFLFLDGSRLSLSTSGRGTSGTLRIRALRSVEIDHSSAMLNGVNSGSTGSAGSITIEADRIAIAGKVSLATFGSGNAGSLTLRADTVHLTGAGLLTSVAENARGNGGSIKIEAGQLRIQDGATVSAGTRGNGSGGNIQIRASDSVSILGNSNQVSSIGTPTTGGGRGGDISISTAKLTLQDGAIVTSTFGSGNAGNITLRPYSSDTNLSNVIQVSGRRSRISATVFESNATGNGGTLSIETGRLIINRGAEVRSGTFGIGQSGFLRINVRDSVILDGSGSGLFTQTEGTGNAQTLSINSARLEVRNGARISSSTTDSGQAGRLIINLRDSLFIQGDSQITASTRGQGNAGAIEITANTINALQGGRIQTIAFSRGNAGGITLTARDTLQIINGRISAAAQSSRGGSININAINAIQLDEAGRITAEASGRNGTAGGLQIRTEQLIVEDGSEISVSSPQGRAGNLRIDTNAVRLNRGILSANIGGQDASGAEIFLRLDGGNLFLQNSSRISARATGTANGGNVTIDTPDGFVIAPRGDNDIVANAFLGQGGNIQITSQGIFGFAEPSATPDNLTNNIDASSEFGSSGTVTLNSQSDPIQGLTELPTNLVDASQQIAQSCPGIVAEEPGESSTFIVTGRGALPPNPSETLSSESTQVGWYTPDATPNATNASPTPAPPSLTEASQWVVRPDGKVHLIATAPIAPSTPARCPQ